MTTVIEVVFENGVFRPLGEADFKENHRYKMIVEEPVAESAEHINGAADVVETTEKPDTYCIREMEWLSKRRHEYPGEYVALDGDRLVSHGADGREIYRQARAAGVKVPFMAHIEPADALSFGGW
ncbi:MAG TPA: antitoxin AF2212-like protein [Blastocatellia bacterium]|nr:antitoxin AF2212-like protein [Blastocatellia bacterium]